MSEIISQLGTKVIVNIDTNDLEGAKGVLEEYDNVLDKIINNLKNDEVKITSAVSQLLVDCMTVIIASQSYLTGRMAESTTFQQNGNTADVGVTAVSDNGFPYPLAIEFGRREIIKTDGFLRWVQDGQTIFSHRSGAVAPKPFVEKSIEKTLLEVEPVIYAAMSVLKI